MLDVGCTFDMPYRTCTKEGSTNFLMSSESTDVNGSGSGISFDGKTALA